MEVRTTTQVQNFLLTSEKINLLDSFLLSSNNLGNDSLKVDKSLFIEAASKKNVQFEFIRLKSFNLNKLSFDISNAKNALLEADYGIADSGKIVVDTKDSDVLLTIFLAETLHIILPASKILHSMDDLELIKGVRANDLGRGITSFTSSEFNKEFDFSPNIWKTTIYVIDDL